MPRFDGTGPSGRGAGTGRGMGPCKKKSVLNKIKLKNKRKVDE